MFHIPRYTYVCTSDIPFMCEGRWYKSALQYEYPSHLSIVQIHIHIMELMSLLMAPSSLSIYRNGNLVLMVSCPGIQSVRAVSMDGLKMGNANLGRDMGTVLEG